MTDLEIEQQITVPPTSTPWVPVGPGPATQPLQPFTIFPMNFVAGTTTPPNPGEIRLDATQFYNAANLYISTTDANGYDITESLDTFQNGQQVCIRVGNGEWVWTNNGVSSASGYYTIAGYGYTNNSGVAQIPVGVVTVQLMPKSSFVAGDIGGGTNYMWIRSNINGNGYWAAINTQATASVTGVTDIPLPGDNVCIVSINAGGGSVRSLGNGHVAGQQVTIMNTTSSPVTITAAGANPSGYGFIGTNDGNSVVLGMYDSITLVWDPFMSRWSEINRQIKSIADTAWHLIGTSGQIPFNNGFTNWDGAVGTGRNPRYRKLSSGLVVISGVISTPATGSTTVSAFTMPAGYRPASPYNVNIPLYSGLTTIYASVGNSGDMTFALANSGAPANSTWIYLEGFTYFAEA